MHGVIFPFLVASHLGNENGNRALLWDELPEPLQGRSLVSNTLHSSIGAERVRNIYRLLLPCKLVIWGMKQTPRGMFLLLPWLPLSSLHFCRHLLMTSELADRISWCGRRTRKKEKWRTEWNLVLSVYWYFWGFSGQPQAERGRGTFGLCRVPEAHESRRKLQ